MIILHLLPFGCLVTSSRYFLTVPWAGLVRRVWLWYFLIIHTYFFISISREEKRRFIRIEIIMICLYTFFYIFLHYYPKLLDCIDS